MDAEDRLLQTLAKFYVYAIHKPATYVRSYQLLFVQVDFSYKH